MKLYHGTSERLAADAMAHGLHPRRKSKRKSNWKMTSARNAVYLTNAYALYYALNAVKDSNDRPAILEIDISSLDPELFAPDEDTLEQQGRGRDHLPSGWTMQQRTRWYRDHLTDFTGADQWKASLRLMGNCTYLSDIPVHAIKRAAYICPERACQTCIVAMGANITLPNYRFCGPKYRAVTQWIFNDEPDDKPVFYGEIPDFGACWSFMLPPESERAGITLMEYAPEHA